MGGAADALRRLGARGDYLSDPAWLRDFERVAEAGLVWDLLVYDEQLPAAHHATITATLSMPVFFCDPHHPWQRGTNENTNRLLRQYLHKNADLGSFTQDHLNCVAAKLNHRPRRVLDWTTPAEAFSTAQPHLMPLRPA